MENLDPTIVSEVMKEEKLISSADLYIISKAPIGHMRNSHIFEHIRHMETPDLFKFIGILQTIDSQKHISDQLAKGMYLCSYICT